MFPRWATAATSARVPWAEVLAAAPLTRHLAADHRGLTPPHRQVQLRDADGLAIGVTHEYLWADPDGDLAPLPPLCPSAVPAGPGCHDRAARG